MYKNILIPLDGSELAEVVFPYVKQLAGKVDLDLTLFHVCESHSESQLMCQAYLERAADMVRAHSREARSIMGAPSEEKAVEVRGQVVVGHPAEEILRYSEENKIDLILMATHGRSGIRRWVLGSVADKVLRKSMVPVWLVRANIPEKIIQNDKPGMTLLVPLDGSKFAESVLPHVQALAKQLSVKAVNVLLIRVYEKPFITADYPEPDWSKHVERMVNFFRDEAERYLADVKKKLSGDGIEVRTEVLMGKPADEIIKYEYNHHPKLVVMATHGSSGLSVWEYGNITDKILHGGNTPLLLVRKS
jgi:nucleotide-binding universal stress UspA family protein